MKQRRVADSIKRGIRQHIESFTPVESHYCRKQTDVIENTCQKICHFERCIVCTRIRVRNRVQLQPWNLPIGRSSTENSITTSSHPKKISATSAHSTETLAQSQKT